MPRKIVIISALFVLCSTVTFAQKISTSKFGDITYNMTQKQVEALNQDKSTAPKSADDEMMEQDVVVNGIKYHLRYYKNLKTKQSEVFMVSSTSTKLSTLSGIKIGSTLDDLWNLYKKYDISVQKIESDDETKSNRLFFLNDIDNGCVLDFYLKNNKVVKIALSNDSGYLNNNIYEN